MRNRKYQIVAEVTAETMAGDTMLERAINSLVTRSFIGTKDLPSDECLSEAKEIVQLSQDFKGQELKSKISEYLTVQFSPSHGFLTESAKKALAVSSEMSNYLKRVAEHAAHITDPVMAMIGLLSED